MASEELSKLLELEKQLNVSTFVKYSISNVWDAIALNIGKLTILETPIK